MTRTIAVLLLFLVFLQVLPRRAGWRPMLAVAVAGALPLIAYAGWFQSVHGRYSLAAGDGVSLWARTMTFADCRKVQPPPDLAGLCPNGSRQDSASEYVWAPDSAINQAPGGIAGNNEAARSFALRAIARQPLDYLSDVARDTSLAFTWKPIAHPKRTRPAYGFARERSRLPDQPVIDEVRREYDPGIRGQRSVEPYADVLIAYQYPAYLRGPLLLAILVLGGAGTLAGRRMALMPWGVAVTLLIAPVAVLDFDHRYVLPVVPVACLAAAFAAAELRFSGWFGLIARRVRAP